MLDNVHVQLPRKINMANNNTLHNQPIWRWMVTILLFLVMAAPMVLLPNSCVSNKHTLSSISSPSKLSRIPDHCVPQVRKGKTCCASTKRLTSSRQCHCPKADMSQNSRTFAIIPTQCQWDIQPAKQFTIVSWIWVQPPVLHTFSPPELLHQPISFALTVVHTTVLLI